MFQLESNFAPAGDQPRAIEQLIAGFNSGMRSQTLLGATGTGKTFTMAHTIQALQKPTLIISHNKTLAAQLATEFKSFFPNNAVHYFVSYFDYYQPESYLPDKDMYIEKEATINEEIEMYRLSTLASLLTRQDVIVVASVSSLYGLGQKEFFQEHSLHLTKGKSYDFRELKNSLLKMQYQPVQSKIEPGMFDFQGEMIDIYSSTDRILYRLHFNEEKLEIIDKKDATSFRSMGQADHISIWPATQFLQDVTDLNAILEGIMTEMEIQVKNFEKEWRIVEAQRLQKRVTYDVRMIRETGFVAGIENYSRYFDRRHPGETTYTIFDYFPEDFLMMIDESHLTVGQLQAMPKADHARKINLIKHGFRLPSAIDHRPLRFDELSRIMTRDASKQLVSQDETLIETFAKVYNDAGVTSELIKSNNDNSVEKKKKSQSKTLFVSATPAKFELELADQVVEQIIRPTGLLDPVTMIYPKSGDYTNITRSLDALLLKKPYLQKYFDNYNEDEKAEVFEKEADSPMSFAEDVIDSMT